LIEDSVGGIISDAIDVLEDNKSNQYFVAAKNLLIITAHLIYSAVPVLPPLQTTVILKSQ
jgi:hypothetical protein